MSRPNMLFALSCTFRSGSLVADQPCRLRPLLTENPTMQYRKLGRTDIDVSVVCQGCWSIVSKDSTWGRTDPDDAVAAIRASLDAGVNFFDTARVYGAGESEELLARALGTRRKDVVVATKLNDLDPAEVRRQCTQSLRRLRSDYIDLYQIHWPQRGKPLAAALEEMDKLRREGKIRAIGVSNFGVSYMTEALAARRFETNQLAYSLLWRPVEYEVQPVCVDNGVGILCYSSLAQGLLTGKFASADDVPEARARTRLFSKSRPNVDHDDPGAEAETFEAISKIRRIAAGVGEPMGRVALAWLLAQPAVTSVIVGGRTAAQAVENAAAGDLKLDDETLAELSAATEPVKQRTGANCDMWQSNSRMEK